MNHNSRCRGRTGADSNNPRPQSQLEVSAIIFLYKQAEQRPGAPQASVLRMPANLADLKALVVGQEFSLTDRRQADLASSREIRLASLQQVRRDISWRDHQRPVQTRYWDLPSQNQLPAEIFEYQDFEADALHISFEVKGVYAPVRTKNIYQVFDPGLG